MGDKIVAVDDTLLYFKRFVDTVGASGKHKLRIARLRAATDGGTKKPKRDLTKKRSSIGSPMPLVSRYICMYIYIYIYNIYIYIYIYI